MSLIYFWVEYKPVGKWYHAWADLKVMANGFLSDVHTNALKITRATRATATETCLPLKLQILPPFICAYT
jgi:hypothetical protein